MISSWIDVKKNVDNINPAILVTVIFTALLLASYIFYNPNYIVTKGCVDISKYLNNPLRVINGELPYRDFWLVFPPGEVFFPAFIYKLFGVNINILFFFFMVISSCVGIFSFILGRTIYKDNFFAMISTVLVFFAGSPHWYLGYGYIHMYFLLLLIAAIFFMRYLKNNILRELFLAGIFIGLALLFRIYEVGVVFLDILLVAFIHTKINKKPFSHTVKAIALFSVGFIIPMLIVSLALFRILVFMVRETMVESLLHATSVHFPYFGSAAFYLRLIPIDIKMITEMRSIFYLMRIFFNLTYHSFIFISFMALYLLPFFLSAISIWYLISQKNKKNDKIIVLFFLLWGMFILPKPLSERADISHLSQVVTPLFFLLIFLLQKGSNRLRGNKYPLFNVTVILAISFVVLPTPVSFISKIDKLTKPRYKVSTKYGTLFFQSESDARSANYTIDFINKNTKEQDYIFVTADLIPYYALTKRKNPTYYDSLMDLVYRPSQEKQESICRDILKKNTKLIIHYPDIPYSGDSSLTLRNTCPTLERCIKDNFELVKVYGNYRIYISKN